MSDKPKTTKVYLMVECEVGDWLADHGFSDEDRARLMIEEAILDASKRTFDDGAFFCDWYGPTEVQKPVVLPSNIKDILWQESIEHLPLHEKLREAIIREGKRPAKERWQDMIDRGVINEKGEVLLKGPGCNEDDDA